jgi:ribose transport system permease protein
MNKQKDATSQSRLSSFVSHASREYMLVLFIILLAIAFAIMQPKFLSGSNIENLLRQASINVIISLGLLFPVMTGGIDLSVGAVSGFAGVLVAGFITNNQMNSSLAILLVLLVSVVIGIVIGFMVTKMSIAPFIATLAIKEIIDGVKLIYCQSTSIFIDKSERAFLMLGQGNILGIPIPIWIMLLFAVVLQLITSYTTYGRSLYAMGGNAEAARLAGINVVFLTISVYVIGAFCSAFSGIVLTSRMATGSPLAGNTYVNNAIASVVIGGGSLAGGRGKPSMVLFGGLVIAMVANQLNLMGVQSYVQKVIIGAIIIFAVFFSEKSRLRAVKVKKV